MKFHKILSSLLIVSLLFSGMAFPVQAAVSNDTLSYLQQQDQANEWVVMARRSAGQSVSASQIAIDTVSTTDIERMILGVTAANEDAANFKGHNLIQLLDAQRKSSQIGDVNLLNDDIWGILAYRSAGIPTNDQRISQSRDFLLSNQNSDGGWSHSTSGASDSNDTAMAITALIRAGLASGDPAITNAINYLKTTQNDDGGFGISPGMDSDSASTSWVISALQASGKAPASYKKNNKTPFMFLQTVKHTDGSYKWKASDTKGNPTMTSYVVIAQSGTSYPVAYKTATGAQPSPTPAPAPAPVPSPNPSNPNDSGVQVNYRIEGGASQVCQGSIKAQNALQLIERASSTCGYSYQIESTSFGRYLKRLNADTASGTKGWLYLVNWQQPSVGAEDYSLKSGDYVTWYFGEFDWTPLKVQVINTSTATGNGKPIVEVVELTSGNIWKTVPSANVTFAGSVKQTDSNGRAEFSVGSGKYDYYANKNGHIRSAIEVFTVNINGSSNAPTISKSVPLQATIQQPVTSTPAPAPTPAPPSISFDISVTTNAQDRLDFGAVQPGSTQQQTMTLKNTGNVNLQFTASVQGDQIFKDYLTLDSVKPDQFNRTISANQSSSVQMKLAIPSNYSGVGTKNGDLIIWARP